MTKTYKKLDKDTLEITETTVSKISREELERNKSGLEVRRDNFQARINEIDTQIAVLDA